MVEIYLKPLFYTLILLIIFSCSNKEEGSKGSSNASYDTELAAQTGVKYLIKELDTDRADKKDLEVSLEGFSETNKGHTFKYSDPIEKTFLLDMDKNGFEELYIVTRAKHGNKSAQVLGLSSNVDKSASVIITPDFVYKNRPDYPIYKNFGGENDIYIVNDELVESYPVNNMYALDSVKIVKAQIFFELFINNGDWTLGPVRQINHREE